MKTLTVRWQRLVDEEGQTCERCGATEKEVQKAIEGLSKSLGALGIKVVLEKKALSPEVCSRDISQSNRIWVGKRTLEEWLGAQVGKSLCGFCCADLGETVECRTVAVGGTIYETIPAELIIKAGLLAGAQLIETPAGEPCCPPSQDRSLDMTQVTDDNIQKETSCCDESGAKFKLTPITTLITAPMSGSVTIDGQVVEFTLFDKNIINVASRAKIKIPAACYHAKRKKGCCHGCVIEIDGEQKFACVTVPTNGMNIVVDRADLKAIRKKNLQEYTEGIKSGNPCKCSVSGSDDCSA